MCNNIIIAIDGFSSCGKSTLAKALANRLGYVYIDSGAMYRVVTLYFMENDIPLTDKDKVLGALDDIHIDFQYEKEQLLVFLNGRDVSDEIRQMYISERVSEVSALKEVRVALVALQQRLGQKHNIVMDGRDIGTQVFPQADLKIFMTADPEVRAERRYQELRQKGEQVRLEEVVQNLAHRDHIDTTRKESPLIRAEDAILLDNTHLSEAEQLDQVLQLVSNITNRRNHKSL